ncbi:hypothetical protein YC2023_032683 [Brassica napus]
MIIQSLYSFFISLFSGIEKISAMILCCSICPTLSFGFINGGSFRFHENKNMKSRNCKKKNMSFRFLCSGDNGFRQDMKKIIINLEAPEIYSLDKTGQKDPLQRRQKKMSCCR